MGLRTRYCLMRTAAALLVLGLAGSLRPARGQGIESPPPPPGLAQEEPAPEVTTPAEKKAALKQKFRALKKLDNDVVQTMNQLNRLSDEDIYEVLAECWKTLSDENVRQYVLNVSMFGKTNKVNLHLLDLLHLGASDSAPSVQRVAFYHLKGLAFQDFNQNPNDYAAWYKRYGKLSPEEVARQNGRAFCQEIARADKAQRTNLIAGVVGLDFSEYTPLGKERRNTVLGAGILESLSRCLSLQTNAPATVSGALYVLTSLGPDKEYVNRFVVPLIDKRNVTSVLQPAIQLACRYYGDEASLRRLLTPLLAKDSSPEVVMMALSYSQNVKFEDEALKTAFSGLVGRSAPQWVRYQSLYILRNVKSAWASDMVRDMLADSYPDDIFQSLVSVVGSLRESRYIPTLIALLDFAQQDAEIGEAYSEQAVNAAVMALKSNLAVLAGIPYDQQHGADWWQKWWQENRARQPEEARGQDIPKVKRTLGRYEAGKLFSIRRGAVFCQIGDDVQRAYWLVSPGFVIAPTAGVQPAVLDAANANDTRPGLIVALTDDNPGDKATRRFWLAATQKAFGGKYLVALVARPNPTAAWVTRKDGAAGRLPVERLVADVVKDVSANYPINPAHVFLHAVADSGRAGYACSLEPQTPFRGFYILAAPFRSAQLPALTNARGRRYFLQHSRDDKTAPFFLASAAQEMLQKQGATVKLASYRGDHGYRFVGEAWEPMAEALAWLEGRGSGAEK